MQSVADDPHHTHAIRWLTRNHPELKDAQIIRLVGTTKNTIEAIRDGAHWNSANLTPMDPVTLGLCTQIALDLEVARANKNRPLDEQTPAPSNDMSDQLIPASKTQEGEVKERDVDLSNVFSKFSNLKSNDDN